MSRLRNHPVRVGNDLIIFHSGRTGLARISDNGATKHASPKHWRAAMAGIMEFYNLRWRLEGIREVTPADAYYGEGSR
jgi:hypothetical protein